MSGKSYATPASAYAPVVVGSVPVTQAPIVVGSAPVAQAPIVVGSAPVAQAPIVVGSAPVAQAPIVVGSAPVAQAPIVVGSVVAAALPGPVPAVQVRGVVVHQSVGAVSPATKRCRGCGVQFELDARTNPASAAAFRCKKCRGFKLSSFF
ncbi:hypothetical protein SO694_00045110 [Aureococcus anophagefferens]|uniref:Uncharacterized protein n=1 Tax=Aureococcus anophagefferens TaxID=44056 RepID=A0ABR1G7Q2_AURAN